MKKMVVGGELVKQDTKERDAIYVAIGSRIKQIRKEKELHRHHLLTLLGYQIPI